jgi:hypothetical protein
MNEPLSQAKFLFEKYSEAGAVELLQSLPSKAEKTFENDWLDFKTGKVRDEDLKKIWSKIVGAFANNEGGVVVWGLVSKKDPTTGIDAVHAVECAPDVFALKSRLMELRHNAVDPPVANIEIKELTLSKTTTEGFVVCYIPESSSRPHRSEFSERRFYLRMGDSSRECSVSILRQLFYPKRHSRIQAEVKLIKPKNLSLRLAPHTVDDTASHIRACVELGFRNIGEISVDEVYARISCEGFKLFTFEYNNDRKMFDIEFMPPIIRIAAAIHPEMYKPIRIALLSVTPQPFSEWHIQLFARDLLPRKATLVPVVKDGDSSIAECLRKFFS